MATSEIFDYLSQFLTDQAALFFGRIYNQFYVETLFPNRVDILRYFLTIDTVDSSKRHNFLEQPLGESS